VKLIHTTTRQNADGIRLNGFDDRLSRDSSKGLYFSDRCLNELWPDAVYLEVEIADDVAQRYRMVNEANGYPIWIIPAAVLNANSRRKIGYFRGTTTKGVSSMSVRRTSLLKPGAGVRLCAIDRAVLEAHEAGRSWKSVPSMRSEARFRRTLARAQWRSRIAAAA
jgi:hypothetical protein